MNSFTIQYYLTLCQRGVAAPLQQGCGLWRCVDWCFISVEVFLCHAAKYNSATLENEVSACLTLKK